MNEAKIQCKFRQLNIGDGFPSDDIIQDFSISQINGINAISEIIGKSFFIPNQFE